MSISVVAALDNNFAIGKDGTMPWHLPDDLRQFKKLTLGKHILMGYNTAVSIGAALPERTNLVITRRHSAPYADQITVRSLDEAQAVAGGTGLVVIGGSHVYREALPKAMRMHLTWVDTSVDNADAFFPGVEFREWVETARQHHAADADHAHAFDMVTYVRE